MIIGILFTNCADKKDKLDVAETIKLEKTETEKEFKLEYIDRWNKIELTQTDDEFGEWGGNSDIIIVYSDGEKIYANYSRYLGSYEPPKPSKENEELKKWYEYKELENTIDSVELNRKQLELIENAIMELTKLKINSKTYPSHSGIVNTVISRDSSLIIEDYPSNKWETFQRLKKSITDE